MFSINGSCGLATLRKRQATLSTELLNPGQPFCATLPGVQRQEGDTSKFSAAHFFKSLDLDICSELLRAFGPSIAAIMSDGQIFKPDKDYTKEADKVIPEAQELAKVCLRLHKSFISIN